MSLQPAYQKLILPLYCTRKQHIYTYVLIAFINKYGLTMLDICSLMFFNGTMSIVYIL